MRLFGGIGSIRLLEERMVFILLLVITIGAKEFFRDSRDENQVVLNSLIICLVSIPIITYYLIKRGSNSGRVITIALVFYAWLIVSAFIVPEKLHYGLEKAHLGLLLPLTMGALACSYKRWDEEDVLDHIITFALIVLVFAVLYKLSNGFFDRQVRYGLLGPIPFGWVCGMGAIASLLRADRGLVTILLSLAFVLAVLWSGSKGPAFALAIVAVLKFRSLIGKTMKERLVVLAVFLIGALLVKTGSDNLRAGSALQAMLTNSDEFVEGAGAGSVGVRLEFYSRSAEMLVDNSFFGVGFGAWSLFAAGLHNYPHNLFLEIGSETGIVGLVLLFGLLWSLRSKSKVSFLGYFFILCMLFSGDFSYFRYALFLLLVGTGIAEIQNASITTKKQLSSV